MTNRNNHKLLHTQLDTFFNVTRIAYANFLINFVKRKLILPSSAFCNGNKLIITTVIFNNLKPPWKKDKTKQLLCAILARNQLFVIVSTWRLQSVEKSQHTPLRTVKSLKSPTYFFCLTDLGWKRYQNNFQEHDFLRDLNFPLFSSVLRSREEKGWHF